MYCQRCQWVQLPDDPEVVICEGCLNAGNKVVPKATGDTLAAAMEQAMRSLRDLLMTQQRPYVVMREFTTREFTTPSADNEGSYSFDIESTATSGLPTIVTDAGDWGQHDADDEDGDDAPF